MPATLPLPRPLYGGAATAWLNVLGAQRAHRIIPAPAADTVLD